MRKVIAIAVLVLSMAACKTKQAVVAEQTAEEARAAKEIIDAHYKNKDDFKTLYIKGSARYEDDNQSQNVSVEVRIKKDEIILVSVRVLGITMAKALITPTRVSYYEKLGNKYFDGDYALLSQWLGTELDYNKVQNMLLGRPMDNLNKGTYKASVDNGQYRLTSILKSNITKVFVFESGRYLLKFQTIAQGGQEPRHVDVAYPEHIQYAKAILPSEIKVEAVQDDKVHIDLKYNNLTFDEDLTFPYEVPSGYDKIELKGS